MLSFKIGKWCRCNALSSTRNGEVNANSWLVRRRWSDDSIWTRFHLQKALGRRRFCRKVTTLGPCSRAESHLLFASIGSCEDTWFKSWLYCKNCLGSCETTGDPVTVCTIFVFLTLLICIGRRIVYHILESLIDTIVHSSDDRTIKSIFSFLFQSWWDTCLRGNSLGSCRWEASDLLSCSWSICIAQLEAIDVSCIRRNRSIAVKYQKCILQIILYYY